MYKQQNKTEIAMKCMTFSNVPKVIEINEKWDSLCPKVL